MPICIRICNQLGLNFQRTPENVSSGHGWFLSKFPSHKTNYPPFQIATLHRETRKKYRYQIFSILAIANSKSQIFVMSPCIASRNYVRVHLKYLYQIFFHHISSHCIASRKCVPGLILAFKMYKLSGGRLYTQPFKYPQRKKSGGLQVWGVGGHNPVEMRLSLKNARSIFQCFFP